MATSVALQPQLTAYGASFYECPPHQLRGEGTTAAWPSRLPPRLLSPDRPTMTLPRRGRSTALAGFAHSSIPRAPHLSRAVLLPRYARAHPAPVAPWSAIPSGPDAATRPATSPLRGSHHPVPTPASGLCHAACGARVTPSPLALPTRNRDRSCKRSLHALLPPRHCTCEAGSCRAPYPGWHCGCRAASFQPPAPPPSPAAPTQATPAKLSCPVLNPRRSRAFHAAHAPRQRLTQACAPGQPLCGLRGVEHPASQAGKLDLFLSSTGPVRHSLRRRRIPTDSSSSTHGPS